MKQGQGWFDKHFQSPAVQQALGMQGRTWEGVDPKGLPMPFPLNPNSDYPSTAFHCGHSRRKSGLQTCFSGYTCIPRHRQAEKQGSAASKQNSWVCIKQASASQVRLGGRGLKTRADLYPGSDLRQKLSSFIWNWIPSVKTVRTTDELGLFQLRLTISRRQRTLHKQDFFL